VVLFPQNVPQRFYCSTGNLVHSLSQSPSIRASPLFFLHRMNQTQRRTARATGAAAAMVIPVIAPADSTSLDSQHFCTSPTPIVRIPPRRSPEGATGVIPVVAGRTVLDPYTDPIYTGNALSPQTSVQLSFARRALSVPSCLRSSRKPGSHLRQ